jgi:glycosyltransferase involved in cell wall biosynthesis
VHRETKLPWVAHFSDPWVDSPYAVGPQWLREIWQRMEHDVVSSAQALVFVTEETADLVMRKYPEAWRQKAAVVPHGYERADAPREAAGARRPGPMRIVHSGRFYSGMRTPIAVFKALAQMNARDSLNGRLELLLVGPHTDEFRRDAEALGIGHLVTFPGRVSPAEAERIAGDADALLVVDAPSDGPSVFLPSKLVDYLPMRKPILGVTPEHGASAALLRRLGCAVAPPGDVDAIARMLGDSMNRFAAGAFLVSPSFDRIAAEYDIRCIAPRLDQVLVRAFGL